MARNFAPRVTFNQVDCCGGVASAGKPREVGAVRRKGMMGEWWGSRSKPSLAKPTLAKPTLAKS